LFQFCIFVLKPLFKVLLFYSVDDCYMYSDRAANEPVQRSSGKVNAIAGANRRRHQLTVAELEQAESSTSTSDESSDDEMDTEPSENVLIQPSVSDAVCDMKTDSASVDADNMCVNSSASSQQQDLVEHSAAKNAFPVTVRQTAVYISVNRTAAIQVFIVFMC